MTDALVDLDELEALAKAATPGPWCPHPNGTSVWEGPDWDTINYEKARTRSHRHVCNATSVDRDAVDDMEFIAALNPATALTLIAELRAARAELTLEKTRIAMMSDAADMREDDLEALRVRLGGGSAPPADEVAGLTEDIAKLRKWCEAQQELYGNGEGEALDRIENHLKGKR
jgi:hypothetical protein